MRKALARLLRDTSGQDLAEYALLLALLTLVVAAVLPDFAAALAGLYKDAAQVFTTKTTCCD